MTVAKELIVRRSATKPKRQREWHGGQRIGCIVQSVTQECDRPARHYDQRLNTGSDQQNDQ
jgi:hypothetical protein